MKKPPVRVLHYFILLAFIIFIALGVFQTFFIYSNGTFGPLYHSAGQMDFTMLVFRRISGIVTWLIIIGFSAYLAITEINPRRRELQKKTKRQKMFIMSVHWFIMLNFFSNIIYSLNQMIFISKIMTQDTFEKIVIKRLYTVEVYIALLGLGIYILLTEIMPRIEYYSRV